MDLNCPVMFLIYKNKYHDIVLDTYLGRLAVKILGIPSKIDFSEHVDVYRDVVVGGAVVLPMLLSHPCTLPNSSGSYHCPASPAR